MSFFFVKNKNLEKTCFKRSGIEHGYLCILGIPSSLGTCNSNNNASHHYYYCFFSIDIFSTCYSHAGQVWDRSTRIRTVLGLQRF